MCFILLPNTSRYHLKKHCPNKKSKIHLISLLSYLAFHNIIPRRIITSLDGDVYWDRSDAVSRLRLVMPSSLQPMDCGQQGNTYTWICSNKNTGWLYLYPSQEHLRYPGIELESLAFLWTIASVSRKSSDALGWVVIPQMIWMAKTNRIILQMAHIIGMASLHRKGHVPHYHISVWTPKLLLPGL